MAVEARPAATVIVMRDGNSGPELLMLKRSGSSGFFPHAWVFPGGRVDSSDQEAARRGSIDGVPPRDHAYAVAAIRETFEEAGVWLGDGTPPPTLREALNSRNGSLGDAPMLVADIGRLEWWSWWITPELEPKRYDTRFFVTLLGESENHDACHDDKETVSSIWIRPSDAVTRSNVGDFFLAPPTFLTLQELSMFSTGAEIMEAAARRDVRPILPRLDVNDGTWAIVLPGDPAYPSDTPVDGATRVEFRQGRWWSS